MQFDFLQKKLDERVEKGNIRSLKSSSNLIDFVSNDYLGLARDKELFQRIHERAMSQNILNGGTGSRLLSGNHTHFTITENLLAGVFRSESTLIFNSGYAANQTLVSSVADRGDTILYDQFSHVCLKEGAWLSRAETVSFMHNDINDLEKKLTRAKGRIFVVTESVFSMDGDEAPLETIVDLCEKHNAYLIVDEAHSTGVYGVDGSGACVRDNLHERIFARVYTFGKAMGVHGACVAGHQVLKDYLINFGHPFIYTTALPPHSIIAIEESFRFLHENLGLQSHLEDRIRIFRNEWKRSVSGTAIQPVFIGSNEKARAVSGELQQSGFDVRAILSPTVKSGTERLRISLHVHNTPEEIVGLAADLKRLVPDDRSFMGGD